MTPRMDTLQIPEGSARYFSIDLDEWRRVQLEGAAAELAKLDEELPPLKKEVEDTQPDPTTDGDSLEEVAWKLEAGAYFTKEHRHGRLTALVDALKPLPKRGLHHLKFPGFAKAHAFKAWTQTGPPQGLYYGVLIGLYWSHRGQELDAKLSTRPTGEQFDSFGEEVMEELQDSGYVWQEIRTLAGQCDESLASWIKGLTEAKAVADFTSPKGA